MHACVLNPTPQAPSAIPLQLGPALKSCLSVPDGFHIGSRDVSHVAYETLSIVSVPSGRIRRQQGRKYSFGLEVFGWLVWLVVWFGWLGWFGLEMTMAITAPQATNDDTMAYARLEVINGICGPVSVKNTLHVSNFHGLH